MMEVVCHGRNDEYEFEFAVSSESTPGLWYRVIIRTRPDDKCHCQCDDWHYRSKKQEFYSCKHVQEILDWIEINQHE